MKLRIKELREEYQMTQKELAQKISNVQRNVSNWENGTSEPDCQTILMIAEMFDVSIDELFGREYSPVVATDNNNDDISALTRLIRRLNGEQRIALKNMLLAFLN